LRPKALFVVAGILRSCAGTSCDPSNRIFTLIAARQQSSDYLAPEIDTRIRDFLSTLPGIIRNTPASDFENFRSGAATDVAETDKVDQV
jgi:hypothetical protein